MAWWTRGDDQQAQLGIDGFGQTSPLMHLLETEAIVPGTSPSYEVCKMIYAYHPLGGRMVDTPLEMAMAQRRKLTIAGAPEDFLIPAFEKEWGRTGKVGADTIIFRSAQISRIYGIGTLAVNVLDGEKMAPTKDPLPDDLYDRDLVFNIYDPLNTAGSLVLNQDPHAADFMHPRQVRVGSDLWSGSKTLVMMHEQPIWIEWTDSAFGFVGRSVFQRAFYPLKSFLNSMLADSMIQDKLGLLVYKAKSPGSILDNKALGFMNMKRQAIKGARTNNVVSIGETESLEAINMEHVQGAGDYSRGNILKNIGVAANMPAMILTDDKLAEGFGEGSEDSKKLAKYIDRVRIEINPAYEFMDPIVMRKAWTPALFELIKQKYPEKYEGYKYETAFQEWRDGFKAEWPNLLVEPDSEKMKAGESRIRMAIETAKTLMEHADPTNKAMIATWLADTVSNEEEMFKTPLLLDEEALTQELMQRASISHDEV